MYTVLQHSAYLVWLCDADDMDPTDVWYITGEETLLAYLSIGSSNHCSYEIRGVTMDNAWTPTDDKGWRTDLFTPEYQNTRQIKPFYSNIGTAHHFKTD